MSQFKVYSSSDNGAPVLNGFSGSLIPILNWCLITGSGWLQPSASITNAKGDLVQAVYKQPSGSGCILYVNDGWPDSTAKGQEAWATGWEGVSTMSVPCGTGSGQFPIPEQLLTSGHYVVRKSNAADSTIRVWTMYADAYTFYFFALSENTAIYAAFFFGDYYTLDSKFDPKHCFISAKAATGTATDYNDTICFPGLLTTIGASSGYGGSTPRTSGMTKGSMWIYKLGDMGKASTSLTSNPYVQMTGVIPYPNATGDVYICPLTVWQGGTVAGMIRGRFRGMYHLAHPLASVVDGQVISGSGAYANKVFQIVKQGVNSGFWTIEISNTLETN